MNSPYSTLALLDTDILDALLPFGVMATIVIVWIASLYLHAKKKKMYYDLVRLAIEKGQPPPLEFPETADDHEESSGGEAPGSDLRRGLVWLAVGMGIFVWQVFKEKPDWTPSIGAIPGFVGLALLINYFFASPSAKTPATSADSPTQP